MGNMNGDPTCGGHMSGGCTVPATPSDAWGNPPSGWWNAPAAPPAPAPAYAIEISFDTIRYRYEAPTLEGVLALCERYRGMREAGRK